MTIPRKRNSPRRLRPLRLSRWIGRNWARVSYAIKVEPTWWEVNRHDLPVEGLGSAFDGLCIVQLSDFHCGRQLPSHYLAEVLHAAQAERPDVIVLTGDFVHKGHRYVQQAAECLGQLSAPRGVFAVLGNHDHSIRNSLGFRRYRHLARHVTRALTNEGIRVLCNETVTFRQGGQKLHLIGVDDLWSRRCDPNLALAPLDSDTPRLLLAHNPHTIEHITEHRCDVVLSGHTHGGQLNLPRLGRVTLSKKSKTYAAGLYRRGKTHLYVNKGVGFGWRVRFGVRPEIAVFRLCAAPLCPTDDPRV